jgi:hypothetical protein
MKITNLLLVIIGVIIFAVSFLAGGYLFHLPYFGSQIMWIVGLIFVALGLWLNEKDKKSKK